MLCEKPLTTNERDCERIIDAVQNRNLKFMVHHQLRYVPAFYKARQFIKSGQLGAVFAIENDYYHYMKKRAVKFDDWRVSAKNSQNVVLGGGCHAIDLMQWLVGDRIAEVFAYGNHIGWPEYPGVDSVMALFRFSNGAIGKMTIIISCRRPVYHPLVVMGTDGTLVNGTLYDENGMKRVVHLPNSNLRRSRRLIGRITSKCYDMIQYPFDHNEHDLACEALIDQFLDCVLYDRSVPITVEESARVIKICLAVIESYRKGKPMQIVYP